MGIAKTCKLEYIIRTLDNEDKTDIIYLIDHEGYRDFATINIHAYSNFTPLDNPPEDEFNKIIYNSELYSYQRVSARFITIFTTINEILIRNNIKPIFEDPNDIDTCLAKRKDLIAPMSYDRANKFFGVDNFWDYSPPKYK